MRDNVPEVLKQALEQALEALKHHMEQTRTISQTERAIIDICRVLDRDSGSDTSAVIDRVINAYKEHYDFPPQGESHMRDCLADALDTEPWIPTGDGRELPELGEPCLVFMPRSIRGKIKEGCRATLYQGAEDWYWRSDGGIVLPNHVTHWKHMPAAPDQP